MDAPDIDILTTAQAGILSALRTAHGDEFQIDPYPDSPDDFALTHPKGVMLLVFKRWRLDAPTTAVGSDQPTRLEFQLSLLNRSLLRGKENPGAYDMITKAFSTLQGMIIGNAALECRDISLVSIRGNRYHYAQLWQLPVFLI